MVLYACIEGSVLLFRMLNDYMYAVGGLGRLYVFRSMFYYSGLAMLDGYMYAVGGWDGTMRLDTIEQYNLYTNAWCFVSNMKMALTSPAVAAVDGCLFVTGL